MSSPTRYWPWSYPLINGRVGMGEVQEPDPDPDDPTDYASQDEGGAVQVGIDLGAVAKVQDDTTHAGAGTITGTFGATPQVGNTLIAVLAVRGWTTAATMLSSGWTAFPEPFARSLASDGGRIYWWHKTAGPSESTSVAINATDVKDLYIAEWSGLGGLDDSEAVGDNAASTTMVTGSIDPTGSDGVIFAGFVQASRNGVLALQAPFTEDWDVDVDASGPSAVFGHQIVDPFSGSYTATATSNQSDSYGSIIGDFITASAGTAWYPGPAANDGDTGTSAFSDSADECLRVALDVERLIYRMDIDIGQETAGATVYELYGTDDATFASPTLLATLTFTATGSYTMDSETVSWVPTASYQYYQLVHISGGGTGREFFEVHLFSALTSGGGVTDHPALSGRDEADQHPAGSVTVSPAVDGETEVQGALENHETRIDTLEAGGGDIVPVDHGSVGATETIDVAAGVWHQITLDANCTITVTGYTTDVAVVAVVKVIQNGTGGWDLTWDSDVIFAGDDQPGQTAGDVTWFMLWSDEGDSVIYGAILGGSGVTYATPAIVLGTSAAAGAATTVIRSDSTIVAFDATVPVTQAFSDAAATGSAAIAARRDHRHGMPASPSGGGVGPILITDTPAGSPLIFGDLLQDEDGTDLLYADV